MKINKGGNSYKIKMSDVEYEVIKRAVFEKVLPLYEDFDIRNYLDLAYYDGVATTEDIIDVAKTLKGVE